MIDYSQFETASAVPEATSMIETFRAIGYAVEGAIADIIDNSISAGARNVWVSFEWKGSETWIAVKDDGRGMDNAELIKAMTPGSRNPLEERTSRDLGRFGLGLKTASFSQCRRLSVVSKREGGTVVSWTWDFDFVDQTGKWELTKYLPDREKWESEADQMKSGTVVIWNDIDRLVGGLRANDPNALQKFLLIMERMKKHIAMVFHRFIESGIVKFYFQDMPVSPWNPFLTRETATQALPEDPIQNGKVVCKGYVLPHRSKISEEAYKEAEGPKGWNEQQGFYIYRNQRLLVAGEWLELFRKEEHYKLARIQIDLPNTLDAEWQIDIKKSVARPPLAVRDQLKAYASTVRSRAVEVYRHRGKSVKKIPGQAFVPLWLEHKRGDKWFYKINRDHPLLIEIKELAATKPDKAIDRLARFIEETIPTKSIYIKESEASETFGLPFEGVDQEHIRKTMQLMYGKLTADGKSPDQAKAIILNIEPFNHFPHFLGTID